MAKDTQIASLLAGLPTQPGVYIMKDAQSHVLYVGKAKVLRNRVRSYFHESAAHPPKTEQLVAEVADFEWIVTSSDSEALILECELIKKHKPRYNVRFKDDKRYPYIKITMQEDYPRVFLVRNVLQDGARYFGPHASSWAMHQTLELLRRLFPYRTCNREITGKDRRPCLYYHIKRCGGPCIGAVNREEYRAQLDRVCLFLEGKLEEIVGDLHTQMEQEAEALNYERAAQLRDQVEALTRVIETEEQRIVSDRLPDHDFVALARQNGQACVQVFFVRGGKVIGREYFVLTSALNEADSEMIGSFLKQFYDEAPHIPREILVQKRPDDAPVIAEWLTNKRGAKVSIRVPRRDDKRDVMRLVEQNAEAKLDQLSAEWEADTNKHVIALGEIQETLGLPAPPSRIECYDISNIQGVSATGSMVVYAKGVPSRRDYRRFRIKTVEGPNDFASMAEVLHRRFHRGQEADAARGPDGKENRWAIMPDLVLVDGGKGQVSAALAAMQEEGVGDIPVAGLAKQNEELYVPGRSQPIILPRDSEGLYLLQRIRDEAHRFAITYHRQLREKRTKSSLLDQIPGIGPRRRKALLERFGSLAAIRQASVEELATVPGMNRRAAEQLIEHL
ncbi:MAG: excinuclease ABC subunit C [Chloroflexi bacterium RBG_13_56_8]|nr:MAG: excinuclease ABC subunit C [Chloroflexi bacterium RBG_13_56_8]